MGLWVDWLLIFFQNHRNTLRNYRKHIAHFGSFSVTFGIILEGFWHHFGGLWLDFAARGGQCGPDGGQTRKIRENMVRSPPAGVPLGGPFRHKFHEIHEKVILEGRLG